MLCKLSLLETIQVPDFGWPIHPCRNYRSLIGRSVSLNASSFWSGHYFAPTSTSPATSLNPRFPHDHGTCHWAFLSIHAKCPPYQYDLPASSTPAPVPGRSSHLSPPLPYHRLAQGLHQHHSTHSAATKLLLSSAKPVNMIRHLLSNHRSSTRNRILRRRSLAFRVT